MEQQLTQTIEETARQLGINRNSAYGAARRGEIPTIRIGRRLLVPKAALRRMLGGEATSGEGGPKRTSRPLRSASREVFRRFGIYPAPAPGLPDDLRHAALLAIDLAELMLAGDASKAPLHRAVELAEVLVRLYRLVEPELYPIGLPLSAGVPASEFLDMAKMKAVQ